MATERWEQSVRVHAGRAGATLCAVNSTERAAEILLYKWPVKPGPKNLKAQRLCLRCLEGKCSPEQARAAFIAAAEEADILAR